MRICIVGSGYVGLVTGACFAESGNHVIAVDRDESRIRELSQGRCPFYEPGLEEIMLANLQSGRLQFTTTLADGIAKAQVIFLAVGTPPRADGSADLTALEAVAAEIAARIDHDAVVVVKSTAPVGTGARLQKIMAEKSRQKIHLVSNPEFLKEGAAIDDFMRPDRVVIGADDESAGQTVADLYKPFVRNNRPILMMPRAAAELTKYAANAYLSTRISFINEIADACGRLGIDIDHVRRGIGTDARIGQHFMYPGVGYGGSCFPKDVQALASFARAAGTDTTLLDSVHRRNQRQREQFAETILTRLGRAGGGRKVAVWGLAFKPKTDDVREAPSISVMQTLLDAGYIVAAHDPKAMDATRAVLGDRIRYEPDAYAVLPGAEALVIFTEWMEFRSPDFDRLRSALKQPLIFDGRNLYEIEMIRRYGFEYHSIGRPAVLR